MFSDKLIVLTLLVVYVSAGLIRNDYANNNKNEPKRTPTLMISMSGFRADKLDEYLGANAFSYMQKEFVEVGAKADYMIPSFPSNIFPSHYSMITGLYSEHHGIIGDKYYDHDNKKLQLLSPEKYDMNVKYWNKSEPLWMTANAQGVKTASSFWIGGEVITREPDLLLSYDNSYSFEERSEDIVNWFKKFEVELGLFFINEPYQTGIKYGPDSEEYANKIAELDILIGSLLKKLERAGILDTINIVLVSDSGLTNFKETILFKDFLVENTINFTVTSYDVVSNIHPARTTKVETIYNKLKTVPNLRVYLKEEMPANLHYSSDSNIAPIVAICDEGYVLDRNPKIYKALSGYDNSVAAMRTIFLARGPDFKANQKLAPFENVNIYSLLCKIMRIDCKSSDGNVSNFLNVLTF